MRRLVLWGLIVASSLSVVWAFFLVSLLPLGVCDSIFDEIRREFQVAHSDDAAKRLAARTCGQLGKLIRDALFFGCVPALVTNLIWCALAVLGLVRFSPGRKPVITHRFKDA